MAYSLKKENDYTDLKHVKDNLYIDSNGSYFIKGFFESSVFYINGDIAFTKGYNDGYIDAANVSFDEGFEEGYNNGFSDGTVSNNDALTGLLSQSALQEFIKNFQNNQDYDYMVVFIDIDDFKLVNDNYGHDQGDSLLIKMGELLRSNIKGNDAIYRNGGDEFVIVFQTDNFEAICDKMVTLQNEIADELGASISIGIAVHEKDVPISETIKKADEAMYYGKHSEKKGNICFVKEKDPACEYPFDFYNNFTR